MNDLISREKFRFAFKTESFKSLLVEDENKIEKLIDNAPVVEAKNVIHGHWIKEEPENKYNEFVYCSVCSDNENGRIANLLIKDRKFLYCPYCGAKMDEVKE